MMREDFSSMMSDLDFVEIEAVGGAEDPLSKQITDWGSDTVMVGASIAGSGALVTQVDSPLPGPADVVGGAMVVGGIATMAVGAVAYVGGSIGQLLD